MNLPTHHICFGHLTQDIGQWSNMPYKQWYGKLTNVLGFWHRHVRILRNINWGSVLGFTLFYECLSVRAHVWHPSPSPFVSTIWYSTPYKPYIFWKLIIWWLQWPKRRLTKRQIQRLSHTDQDKYKVLPRPSVSYIFSKAGGLRIWNITLAVFLWWHRQRQQFSMSIMKMISKDILGQFSIAFPLNSYVTIR